MLLDQTWMNREAKYGASFLISFGGYAALPLAFSWLVEKLASRWKRALGIGIQSAVGNMAGVTASNMYRRYGSDVLDRLWRGTRFLVDRRAGCNNHGLFDVGENRRRDVGGRASRLGLPPEKVANLGDDHPSFRYTI